MCTHTCIPNMRSLCLTLWQGEVYTDVVTNDDDGQLMIVLGSLVDKPNGPKTLFSLSSTTMKRFKCNFFKIEQFGSAQ